MKTAAGFLMIANAALLALGAAQHAGLAIGPFHEPLIIPAAIVETLCCICLLWGAMALLGNHSAKRWRVALTANCIALGGVLLGIAALAAGAGPRTASNDLYHRIMLILIALAVVALFLGKRKFNQG
jgi:ABC-type Fe3+ transport system permease subunit